MPIHFLPSPSQHPTHALLIQLQQPLLPPALQKPLIILILLTTLLILHHRRRTSTITLAVTLPRSLSDTPYTLCLPPRLLKRLRIRYHALGSRIRLPRCARDVIRSAHGFDSEIFSCIFVVVFEVEERLRGRWGTRCIGAVTVCAWS